METPDLPTNDSLIYRINNNYYRFDVSIVNLEGRMQVVKPSAIKRLVIEDSFENFYHKGYIIIDNTFDMIERDYSGINSPASPQYYNIANGTAVPQNNQPGGSVPLNGFVFKGDSRDILRVDIMPSLDSSNPGNIGNKQSQESFRMLYDFAIYHSEDIEGDSPDVKHKKLYFWDLYYELLRTQDTYFTTSQYTKTKNIVNATNAARGVKTGLAIKELLKETFNNPETGVDKYNVDFLPQQLPATPNPSIPAEEQDINWDAGGTSVFFSAPAQFKALDALNYLLSRHVSNAESNFDQCFLRIERSPRAFTLRSLKSYFKDSYSRSADAGGPLYLETVKIGGFTQVENDSVNGWMYELQLVPSKALYFERIGTIRNFNLSDMSGIFSQKELTSKIVHSYNFENSTFQIDSQKGDIEETLKVYKSNYVDPMKGGYIQNFNTGLIRNERKNTQNVFSVVETEKDQRLATGRNKTLYTSIFANATVTFRLPGSTHRQAGRFIGIDRDGAMEASAFDNKILGIYFIIGVEHHFINGEYYTDIRCVKTYLKNQLNSDTSI
jgi:hypothetical protein